jgi:hypothetical protein
VTRVSIVFQKMDAGSSPAMTLLFHLPPFSSPSSFNKNPSACIARCTLFWNV